MDSQIASSGELVAVDVIDSSNLVLTQAKAIAGMLINNGASTEGFESNHETILSAISCIDDLIAQALEIVHRLEH